MRTRSSNLELFGRVIEQAEYNHGAHGNMVAKSIEAKSGIRVRGINHWNDPFKITVYFHDSSELPCALSLKADQNDAGEYIIVGIKLVTHAQLPGKWSTRNREQKRIDIESLEKIEKCPDLIRVFRQSLEHFLQISQNHPNQPLASSAAADTAPPAGRRASAGRRVGRGGGKVHSAGLR